MSTTAPMSPDLQDIAEVVGVKSTNEVNRYLALGWRLLGLASDQHSEHDYTLTYHLGWRRDLGEPQRAETDMELWLKENQAAS